MKFNFNFLFILLILMFSVLLLQADAFSLSEKSPESMPFAVYTDYNARTNHFIPSGWMGDYGAVKIEPASTESPYSGRTCIKLTYTGEPTQGAGWVGVFWQNPENNWGTKDGGYNLSGAKKLVIWARGEKGGEQVEFKIGGITGAYPDSDMIGIGPIALTDQWQEYAIDFQGVDLTYISGGFIWAASRMDNSDGFVVYLDDIIYQ